MKDKICIITTVHAPLDIRIFQKEAKALVQEGYDVSLIAQHERDEIVGGVKIIAIPKSRNRFTRFFELAWRAFCYAFRQKADVYHFHDPELIPCGVLLKILNKSKVVYDVHEDLPKQILTKYWIPTGLRKLVACCSQLTEAMGAFFFDRIVAATPKIAERFPTGKTVVVQNYPRLDELVMENTIPYKQRPPYVVYVGGISRPRGIEEMARAVGLLPEELKVRLVLAGSFSPNSPGERTATASRVGTGRIFRVANKRKGCYYTSKLSYWASCLSSCAKPYKRTAQQII